MPDFVAGLLATLAFCAALTVLNLLTRLVGPHDLAEGGLMQYGTALLLARLTWRRAIRPQPLPLRR